jgi:hypothetical protein
MGSREHEARRADEEAGSRRISRSANGGAFDFKFLCCEVARFFRAASWSEGRDAGTRSNVCLPRLPSARITSDLPSPENRTRRMVELSSSPRSGFAFDGISFPESASKRARVPAPTMALKGSVGWKATSEPRLVPVEDVSS